MASSLQALLGLGVDAGAPLAVTVNGQPLALVLQAVTATLAEQAANLQRLQEYTYSTHQEMWKRIASLEASVARLDADVAIDHRPMHAARHPTLRGAVDDMERRITILDAKRKGLIAEELRKRNLQLYLRRRYHKWGTNAVARQAVRRMMLLSSDKIFAVYWRKLVLFHARRRKMTIASRRVRSLRYVSDKRTFARFFAKWVQFNKDAALRLEERRANMERLAQAMAVASRRGFLRRNFLLWLDWREHQVFRSNQIAVVEQMEAVSARRVVGRAFVKWQLVERAHQFKRRRHRMTEALAAHSLKELVHRRLKDWIYHALRRRRRLASAAVVPRYAEMARALVLRRYYAKLSRHVAFRHERRARVEQEVAMGDVARRCDVLGAQMDVSLRTMANTNAVLSKVVDRLVVLEVKQQQQPPAGGVGASSLSSAGRSALHEY